MTGTSHTRSHCLLQTYDTLRAPSAGSFNRACFPFLFSFYFFSVHVFLSFAIILSSDSLTRHHTKS